MHTKWTFFFITMSMFCIFQSGVGFCAHMNNDDVANWINWTAFYQIGAVLSIILLGIAGITIDIIYNEAQAITKKVFVDAENKVEYEVRIVPSSKQQ